jgi:hypothetical protein
MWLLGVRDWRCYLLALTSPVVVQGLIWGNLTVALVLPLALAWRFRERAAAAGLAVGVAIAAKLFVLPLLAWLVFTRRYGAAAIAAGTAAVLVIVPWAAIGFDGMRDYPALMRELQDVYAVRGASLSSVFGGLGLSASAGVALSTLVAAGMIAAAYAIVGRAEGDRRAFAVVVAACVVAAPITWPNYSALLLVPVAVTWPRLSPVWFFGYVSWLAELLPKPRGALPEPCCRPSDVPEQVWRLSHATPSPWYALGMTAVVIAVTVACVAAGLHSKAERADEVAWP